MVVSSELMLDSRSGMILTRIHRTRNLSSGSEKNLNKILDEMDKILYISWPDYV